MIKVLTDHYSLRYFGRIYGFDVVFTYAVLLNYFAPFLLFLLIFFLFFSHSDPWTTHTTKKGHLYLSFNETEIIVVLLEEKKNIGEQFNTETSGKNRITVFYMMLPGWSLIFLFVKSLFLFLLWLNLDQIYNLLLTVRPQLCMGNDAAFFFFLIKKEIVLSQILKWKLKNILRFPWSNVQKLKRYGWSCLWSSERCQNR